MLGPTDGQSSSGRTSGLLTCHYLSLRILDTEEGSLKVPLVMYCSRAHTVPYTPAFSKLAHGYLFGHQSQDPPSSLYRSRGFDIFQVYCLT